MRNWPHDPLRRPAESVVRLDRGIVIRRGRREIRVEAGSNRLRHLDAEIAVRTACWCDQQEKQLLLAIRRSSGSEGLGPTGGVWLR